MKTLAVALIATIVCPSFGAVEEPDTVPVELIVEAFIDGPSHLHLTPRGVYWVNGWAAKPGRLDANNFPTYVNGRPWTPRWGKNGDDRGEDRSDVFPIAVPSVDYNLEVLAISESQGTTEKENRTLPRLCRRNGELCVDVLDPELGGRWYKLKLTPAPAKKKVVVVPAKQE